MSDILQQAIEAIKAGDEQTGEILLSKVLKADPHNETALMWLFKIGDTLERRRQYVEWTLQVNPDSRWAKRAVNILNMEQAGREAAEMNKLSQQLVGIASQAALQVGDMLLEASARDVSVEEKSSFHDLVTKYDRESEELIADYIFKQYADSTLVGEEGGTRGSGQVRWYVDPIDGTSNFAAGLPFFCVSIGAVLDEEPLAGVIYDPVRRELFTASRQGAFLNGKPIRADGHQTDSLALLLTAFPSPHAGISDGDSLLFAEILRRFATVRRVGSAALALAYVACGRADVVLETSINAWDVVAGMFLVEQAGGRYIPFGSQTSATGQSAWMFPGFVATCSEFDLEQSIINLFLTQAD